MPLSPWKIIFSTGNLSINDIIVDAKCLLWLSLDITILEVNLFKRFPLELLFAINLIKLSSSKDLEFINLKKFYKNKEDISDKELIDFVEKNKDKLKVEYIDFKYAILNPKHLIGTDEFNQSFFDKIDEIEIDISN